MPSADFRRRKTLYHAPAVAADGQAPPPKPGLSDESRACVMCHPARHVNIHQEWGRSKHFGANVGCCECHRASESGRDERARRREEFLERYK